jgi:hypothetical protein
MRVSRLHYEAYRETERYVQSDTRCLQPDT